MQLKRTMEVSGARQKEITVFMPCIITQNILQY